MAKQSTPALAAQMKPAIRAKLNTRVAARDGLAAAIRGAIDATLAASNKIGTLADAIKACVASGIPTDECRSHARRATIAHVMGCDMAAADKFAEKGAERPEKLERALVAFRQSMSRAMALVETGESSVRKAKAKTRKARAPKTKAEPAPVPANIKAVIVPIASKPQEARTFLLDTLALLERSEKSMAKALDGETREALTTCLVALRKLKAK